MDIVHTHCAGLDVHKKTVVPTIIVPGPKGGLHKETRTFGTHFGHLIYNLSTSSASPLAGRNQSDSLDYFTGIRCTLYHYTRIKKCEADASHFYFYRLRLLPPVSAGTTSPKSVI